MTTPERNSESTNEAKALLKSARPDQIKRLLQDIMKSTSNDDFNQTGTA